MKDVFQLSRQIALIESSPRQREMSVRVISKGYRRVRTDRDVMRGYEALGSRVEARSSRVSIADRRSRLEAVDMECDASAPEEKG
jgi:hypothetical protein